MRFAHTLALLLVVGLAPLAAAEEEPRDLDTPAGWLGWAEEITERVEVPAARAALLVSIGSGWVEAGDVARARPLLARAAAFGAKCQSCLTKARRLAEIALLQHQAGDEMGAGRTFEVARKACDELDGVYRAGALAYLAQLRQEAGEEMIARVLFADAHKAADALDGLDRVEALAAVAEAHAAAGNAKRFQRLLMSVIPAGRRLGAEGSPIVDGLLMTGFVMHLDAGRIADAREILGPESPDAVGRIRDVSLLASAYGTLARAWYDAGDPQRASHVLGRALELASSREDASERVPALAECVDVALAIQSPVGLARARGDIGDAAREIEDPALRVRAMAVWIDVLRESGADAEAVRVLADAGKRAGDASLDADTRDGLRAALAGAAARLGRLAEVDGLSGAIADPVRNVRARLGLAEAARRAGNDAQALALCAEQLQVMGAWPADRASDRAESMRQAARLQAACGRPADAAKTVDAIDRPFHAATACTYIASDLTR